MTHLPDYPEADVQAAARRAAAKDTSRRDFSSQRSRLAHLRLCSRVMRLHSTSS
ncbi:hypothetical protein [Yoonia sp.]|uniref:hypothetical protein n=1 Tax=Yoonia sp. TaxID=2212373 RepID=UPI003F702EA3